MMLSVIFPDRLRALLRFIRHAPDRLLHRDRRSRAISRLRTLGEIQDVVFICHGNINRSAYAAAAFERRTAHVGQSVRVRSAGFVGPDRPASDLAQLVARRRGLDLTAHRSRLLDAAELKAADLIVVMNTAQRREICVLAEKPQARVLVLGDLDPDHIYSRTVKDPYGSPEPVFDDVFDRIDRCLAEMASALWTR